MSTPTNPPSSPSGPPTEEPGTPIPEAAAPLSLQKPPPAAAPEAAKPDTPTTPSPQPQPAPEAAADAAPPAPEPAPEHVTATAAEAAPEPAPEAAADAAPPAPQPQAGAAPGAGPGSGGAPQAGSAPGPRSPFAPPASAPRAPGAPAGPGGPVPPGPLWEGGYNAGPWGTHAPATTNGLAVAALVLGIAGLIGGLTPFFFFMGGLTALTAVGLGIGGIVRASQGAGRQAMAITGTVLGVLGIGGSLGGFILTGLVIDRASDRVQHRIDEEERRIPGGPGDPDDFGDAAPKPHAPRPRAPKPSPSQVPGMTAPLPFGETFTYPNGVRVTLSAPKKYETQNQYLKVGNAVQLTLTVTNDSKETLNVIYAVPNVRDEQGMTAKLVFDGELPKMIKGDILPGQSASGVLAYEVPEGTTRLTADISPAVRLPHAKFSGSIG